MELYTESLVQLCFIDYIADNWIIYLISQQVAPKQMYILRFLQRKTNLSSSEETPSLTIYAARFLLSYCNVTQRNSNVEQLMATKLCRIFINIKWILHCHPLLKWHYADESSYHTKFISYRSSKNRNFSN